jgi:AraC-like DNA-binding protein
MIESLSDALKISTILFLVLISLKIINSEKKSFRKNIVLFFIATILGYQFAYWDILKDNAIIFRVSFTLSVSIPYAFWLTSKAIFNDHFVWNKKYWILSFIVILINNLLYHFNGVIENDFYQHFRPLPYFISAGFILLSIYESIKNRENDLIQRRLKMRNIFMIFSAFSALFSVYFFFVDDPLKLPPKVELIQNSSTCLFLLLFSYYQFEFKDMFPELQKSNNNLSVNSNERIKKEIINKLELLFVNEKFYKTEGLTISQLSEKLNEKEYQVRNAINKELGYSNFNTFLNHYRIQEACRIIENDKQRKLTFQEIAFQIGYQSVVTFNRAFKSSTNKTPGEFVKSINN